MTHRTIKVTLTVRRKGQGGPFKVAKRTVKAVNRMEAEHLVKVQMRREGHEVGVILESTSGQFRYSAMARRSGTQDLYQPVNGKIKAESDVEVPALVAAELNAQGWDVGSVYDITDFVQS